MTPPYSSQQHEDIQGSIDDEVISVLTELVSEMLGPYVVKILLRNLGDNQHQGADLVFALTTEAEDLLGKKGAFATLREVGRSLAVRLMKAHPKEEWEDTLANALNTLGFARKIERNAERAFICDCVFYGRLRAKSLQPIEHPVCWTGIGFIEGFLRELDGVRGIQWKERNVAERRCAFDILQ